MANPKKQLNGSPDDIEQAYYEALAQGDIEALMALWADDEEILCIHPGGVRLLGHAAIRASFAAMFERGRIEIRASQLHATQNMLTAVHNLIEEVPLVDDGMPDIHILATNVYTKTPRGWRLSIHHASVASGKAPGLSSHSGVLH